MIYVTFTVRANVLPMASGGQQGLPALPLPWGPGRLCACVEKFYDKPFLSFILASCENFVKEVMEVLEFGTEIPGALGTNGICFLLYNF